MSLKTHPDTAVVAWNGFVVAPPFRHCPASCLRHTSNIVQKLITAQHNTKKFLGAQSPSSGYKANLATGTKNPKRHSLTVPVQLLHLLVLPCFHRLPALSLSISLCLVFAHIRRHVTTLRAYCNKHLRSTVTDGRRHNMKRHRYSALNMSEK